MAPLNDSGMFDTNLHDERYLPFELAGADCRLELTLPHPEKGYPAFDYKKISDVLLHIRDTARPGVDIDKVQSTLDELFKEATDGHFALLFSLRHDFPNEWSAFVNGTGDFTAAIRRDYFPYLTQGKTIRLTGFELYGQDDVNNSKAFGNPEAATDELGNDEAFTVSLGPDASILTRARDLEVFLIIRYSVEKG